MTPFRSQTIAAALGCALLMTGCAVGRRHAYDATPIMRRGSSMTIALAVQDQRQSVTAGGRPDFVGLSRGGFGNAFDVVTKSGQPLAADFATSIRHGLTRVGYRVTPVAVVDRARPEAVAAALVKTGAERLLVVQIDEWYSDTYSRTSLHYTVRMRVLDASGQQVAQAAISGNDVLGGDFIDPAGHAETAVPRAYKQKLEQLLNAPDIARGLAPPAPAPIAPAAEPPPPAEPTVAPVPAS